MAGLTQTEGQVPSLGGLMRYAWIILLCSVLWLITATVRADHESSKQPSLWTPQDEAERLGAMDVPGGMVLVPAGSFLMGSDPRKDRAAGPLRLVSHEFQA